MRVCDLIKEFSVKETLPVDVNDAVASIKAAGIQDEIDFIGVEFDTQILHGYIKCFHRRPTVYGDPIACAHIYYHVNHESDWKRFICCKEVMHLLDPENARVKNEAQIADLAEKIGLPKEMQDPINEGHIVLTDRVAEWQAIAILFPLACRNLLRPKLLNGEININNIAKMADIPRKYVGLAMSSYWDNIHKALLII
jgi:hypothetical protein